MPLFKRKQKEAEDDTTGADVVAKKEKGAWRRPANTAFKQQRLKAWQPILTPKTVLPTFFIIALAFGLIGGLLVWGSSLVSELTFDYTDCDTLTPQTDNSSITFSALPNFSYRLRAKDSGAAITPPQYAHISDPNNAVYNQKNSCIIQFTVPADMDKSVLLYYKLTNFHQNHRRYVKSLNANQLRGDNQSINSISGSDCKPLDVINSTAAYYPCGLIANSIFNDTFTNLTSVDNGVNYTFSEKGIAWPGEAKKYTAVPGNQTILVPPPNWALRFPNGYTAEQPPPNLREDEHFQNWMRVAGLPTFTKLYGRNDADTLKAGRYQITTYMNFPVRPYHGTKSIVITTVSWIGGKNPFLGWAYVAAAGVFIVIAIAGTTRHLIKPRKLGDMSLLSWNR